VSTLNVNKIVDASGGVFAPVSSVHKNRIINGAMVISQRNGTSSVTIANATGTYTLDRWRFYEDTDGVITAEQSTVAPSGFTNSLLVTVTTADTSLGASQFALFEQKVEGFNVADLAWGTASAKPITISFWVRSSLTGTFGGAIANNAFNRSYPFTYTINAANTFEYKTITIAGDTTGTWLTNNGTGMLVQFGLGVGSSFSGTAGAWSASGLISATGATSVVGTSGATFYITGVQLEVGTQATSFEYRQYGTELALCQRYYEKLGSDTTNAQMGIGFNQSTTVQYSVYFFKQTKRAAVTLQTTGTASNYQILHGATATNLSAVSTLNVSNSSLNNAFIESSVASGLTAGQGSFLRVNTSTAFLAFSAEL
jgi:hypothetical protein